MGIREKWKREHLGLSGDARKDFSGKGGIFTSRVRTQHMQRQRDLGEAERVWLGAGARTVASGNDTNSSVAGNSKSTHLAGCSE